MPSDDELKKIHGADVELNPDTSEDDKLTEKEALAQAKKEGIEFIDSYHLMKIDPIGEELPESYTTATKANAALDKLDDKRDYVVVQRRTRKP